MELMYRGFSLLRDSHFRIFPSNPANGDFLHFSLRLSLLPADLLSTPVCTPRLAWVNQNEENSSDR